MEIIVTCILFVYYIKKISIEYLYYIQIIEKIIKKIIIFCFLVLPCLTLSYLYELIYFAYQTATYCHLSDKAALINVFNKKKLESDYKLPNYI